MLDIVRVTLKGIFRDRVFHGIVVVAVALLVVPGLSRLSMRQVTELSITLSLSLVSLILLLLAVFLGGTSLWKDMERRYTFSVLSLPVTRTSYLLGRFFGVALFLLISAAVLGGIAAVVILIVSTGYPPERPVAWLNIGCAVLFDALKYVLLVAVGFLFSTVSTSFFLPIFGAIAIFLVGSASQQVYDFIHSPAGKTLSQFTRQCASGLYYLLPNFSAFDLKVNAVYALPLTPGGIALNLLYFLVYGSLLLAVSSLIFSRREMK